MEIKVVSEFIEYYALQTSKDKDEIEIITYGLKILGSTFLTSVLIILSGVIIGHPISSLIYLSILFLLRRNVGGYHSKTYLGCLCITILNFLIVVLLENNLKQDYKEVLGIVFIIYSAIKIYSITPQVHKNRVINEETIEICNLKKNRNLSIILSIALINNIFVRIGLLYNINYFFIISTSLMIVALSVNKINSKEEKVYEKDFS